MLIIDGHQDIATSFMALGRDFRQPVALTRAREGASPPWGTCTLGLPDALGAGVRLVFGTLFVAPTEKQRPASYETYENAEQAHRLAQRQLDYYRELAADSAVSLVTSKAELEAIAATWNSEAPRLGIVVLMENGDPIRTPAEASDWYAQGVRIVGPAWRGTRYCGGTGQPGPLTADGRRLMSELSRVGMILDTSHLAEQSFWEALDLFDGPVIASHSNCRALNHVRADRHLSDGMITALIGRDAVIGVVLYNAFLSPTWRRGSAKEALGLDAALRHIDHVCTLAGDTAHVAIGSDLDGGFGSEEIPREIDTVADLPRLAEALATAGYDDEAIAAMMGTNWLQLLQRALP